MLTKNTYIHTKSTHIHKLAYNVYTYNYNIHLFNFFLFFFILNENFLKRTAESRTLLNTIKKRRAVIMGHIVKKK